MMKYILLPGRGYYAQSINFQPNSFASQTDLHKTAPVNGTYENNDINGFKIRGRTTLQEIEQSTGVSMEEIAAAMNLPGNLPKNERIAFLKEQYGFDMEKIRGVVRRLAMK